MKKLLIAVLVLLCCSTAYAGKSANIAIQEKAKELYSTAKQKKQTPLKIDGVNVVSIKEAKKLYDKGAVFLDARVKTNYNLAHIEKAVWFYDQDSIQDNSKIITLDKNKPYVTYCHNTVCPRSAVLALLLVDNGFSKVYWMRDGIIEWDKSGLPTKKAVGVEGIPTAVIR